MQPVQILVFITNLTHPDSVNDVRPLVQSLPGIQKWSVDMQDCDHVLRIEATALSPGMVESTLQSAGYYCREMEG